MPAVLAGRLSLAALAAWPASRAAVLRGRASRGRRAAFDRASAAPISPLAQELSCPATVPRLTADPSHISILAIPHLGSDFEQLRAGPRTARLELLDSTRAARWRWPSQLPAAGVPSPLSGSTKRPLRIFWIARSMAALPTPSVHPLRSRQECGRLYIPATAVLGFPFFPDPCGSRLSSFYRLVGKRGSHTFQRGGVQLFPWRSVPPRMLTGRYPHPARGAWCPSHRLMLTTVASLGDSPPLPDRAVPAVL